MMALDLDNSFLFSHQSPLDWDQPSSFSISNLHEIFPSLIESPISSEESVGYLQEYAMMDSNWPSQSYKRRRTELSSPNEDLNYLIQDFWETSSSYTDPTNPLEFLNSKHGETETLSYEPLDSILLEKPISSQERSPDHRGLLSVTESHDKVERRSKKDNKRKRSFDLVYPFNMVKPAGLIEGNVTLNDINKKILTTPARPVKHPVGDYKCGPCVSANGPGLSGKSVVSLMRIQTRGSGSITIIRTRD